MDKCSLEKIAILRISCREIEIGSEIWKFKYPFSFFPLNSCISNTPLLHLHSAGLRLHQPNVPPLSSQIQDKFTRRKQREDLIWFRDKKKGWWEMWKMKGEPPRGDRERMAQTLLSELILQEWRMKGKGKQIGRQVKRKWIQCGFILASSISYQCFPRQFSHFRVSPNRTFAVG